MTAIDAEMQAAQLDALDAIAAGQRDIQEQAAAVMARLENFAGSGMSVDEVAAYWQHIAQADEIVSEAARRELQPRRADHSRWVDEQASQVSSLEARMDEVTAPVTAVETEIAEVKSRLASLKVKSVPLDERLAARQRKVALKEELQELETELATLQGPVNETMNELGPARNALSRMRVDLALFDDALDHPLSYQAGLRTAAGQWWSQWQPKKPPQPGTRRIGERTYQAPDGGLIVGDLEPRYQSQPVNPYTQGSGAAEIAASRGMAGAMNAPQPAVVSDYQPAIALPVQPRDVSGDPQQMLAQAVQMLGPRQ